MKVTIVIPARWGSTRFKGKPLAKINGKEVIKYVWEKANLSKIADKVIVATDNNKIKNFCIKQNINVLMTSNKNKTGTDRIYEVSKKINSDIYVNLQGDEPLIDPKNIDKVAFCLKKNISKKIEVATGYSKVKKYAKRIKGDSSNVYLYKKRNSNEACFFFRGTKQAKLLKEEGYKPFKHIGLYAYTKSVLKRFHSYERSLLEVSQELEQLRFIENNEKIVCTEITDSIYAVDYPNDIKKIEKFLKLKI